MTNARHTKKALFASVMSLLLCFAMLVGTTFAWFTDNAFINVNKIQAGTLDVALVDADGNSLEGKKLDFVKAPGAEAEEILWEPNCTYSLPEVYVQNNGNLALKYKIVISGIDGDTKLNEVIEWTINGADINTEYRLKKGEKSAAIVLQGHMDKNAGNEYQGLTMEGIAITVVATQDTVEHDSFNDQYDADAEYPEAPDYTVSNVGELKDALENAKAGDVIAMKPADYVIEDTLIVPAGVSLIGAQAGIPAEKWVNDPNVQKSVLKATKDIPIDAQEGFIQIRQDTDEVVADVVIDGLLVDCDNHQTKGIYVKKTTGKAMQGIVIKNCAVVNSTNDGIDVCNTDGAVVENNYVSGVMDNGIRFGNYKNLDGRVAYVQNNVVENIEGTINGGISVTNGQGDVVVRNNVVKNISCNKQAPGKYDFGESAIIVEDVYEGGTIIVEDNVLENVEQGIGVYKFTALSENDKVIIRNNTINGYTSFALGTSTLNNKNKAATSVEFQNNTLGGGAAEAQALYVEITNRYGETTANWSVTSIGNTDVADGTILPD